MTIINEEQIDKDGLEYVEYNALELLKSLEAYPVTDHLTEAIDHLSAAIEEIEIQIQIQLREMEE